MNRPITFSISLALLLSATVSLAAAKDAARPNIVFFLTDDQPLRAMSHVDPWFHTPHMDRLAEEGIEFTNGFVECSICCVSRASIMMGQFNTRHGIQSFDDPLSEEQLEQSFPVLLRQAGYRTALLGKYGVGHTRAAKKELCLPAEHFDLWYGFQQSPSYAQMVDGEKRYLTTAMEEKAIRFMKETPEDQPFLLYLCLPEPHGQGGPGGPWNYRDPEFEIPEPSTPPPPVETMTEGSYDRLPEAIQKSKNNKIVGRPEETYTKYMTTVRHYTARSDLAIGRIREALKETGRADNTVIIFSSDNGSMWGAHGIAGKWNMYEESIRVPMMICDPRLPKATRGTRRDQLALNIDLTATIMDIAGVPAPHMQGVSLLPVLKDPDAKTRDDWYYHHDVHTRSKGAPLPKCEGVRTEQFKYIHYKDTDPIQEELFNLQSDPQETKNLSARPEYAEVLEQLRARNGELQAELAGATNGKESAPQTKALPAGAVDVSVLPEGVDQVEIFLLMGQSNMKGRGKLPGSQKTHPRILNMNMGDDHWYAAKHPLHMAGTPDLIDRSDNAGVGPGLAFARTLAQRDDGSLIALVPCARGGSWIGLWGDGREMYRNAIRRAEKALADFPQGKARIAGVLWLQGEADSVENRYGVYSDKLTDLVQRIRRDLKEPTLPFVACTIGTFIKPKGKYLHVKEINADLLNLPQQVPHAACLDARDLKDAHIGDFMHYNSTAQETIGQRYATEFLKLTQKQAR